MNRLVRALSCVGLLLLGGSFLLGAFLAGGACFDACPPDISACAAFDTLGCSLPGLLAAGPGWPPCLLLPFWEDRRRPAALVPAMAPFSATGSAVAVLAGDSGRRPVGSSRSVPPSIGNRRRAP